MRRYVALALGCAVALALAPVRPVGAAEDRASVDEPVRILLVGDSVTQGSAGDWTWRHRLWQHFAAAGVAVDLVGPRQDLYDNVTGLPGSTAYADPGFDQDHAARWGMRVDVPDVPIGDLVDAYDPDVVVEMLGVNDLLYGGRTPPQVVARIGQLVAEARAADPAVDLVLAEATQTWFAGVPALNAGLVDLAATAGTAGSAVTVARAALGYEMTADTWDTSHPNARGEVKIAAAVADALHGLGVGPPATRPLAEPPRGPRAAALLTAAAGVGRATLSWTGSPGATAQVVWGRDATAGDPWRRLPAPVAGSSWTAHLLRDGHRYRFRLQPQKGDDAPEGAVYSNAVTVVPGLPPAAPTRLRARWSDAGAVLTWAGAERATRYQVQVWRTRGWRDVGMTHRERLVVRGLAGVRSWRFRVRSWTVALGGGAARVTLRRR